MAENVSADDGEVGQSGAGKVNADELAVHSIAKVGNVHLSDMQIERRRPVNSRDGLAVDDGKAQVVREFGVYPAFRRPRVYESGKQASTEVRKVGSVRIIREVKANPNV